MFFELENVSDSHLKTYTTTPPTKKDVTKFFYFSVYLDI